MTLTNLAGRAKRKLSKSLAKARGDDPRLNTFKVDAIREYWAKFKPKTFADLGGVWRIDAGYTFEALKRPSTERGYLVDTDFTPPVLEKQRKDPRLHLVNKNFGDPSVAEAIGPVDVVFFFDTLLHQVKPNWNEILAMYAKIAKGFLIYNQQWVGGKQTIRLLDLGEERYLSEVPSEAPTYRGLFQRLDEINPKHQRPWRDVHNIWQWGIVDSDLMRTMDDLGFKLELFRNCAQTQKLKNFEDHLFVYTRRG
jgi:hypothetical protein